MAEVFEEDAIPQDAVIESEVEEDDSPDVPLPSIDPSKVVPKGDSFLASYLEKSMKHPTPQEYHLFLGLQALGLAVGNRIQLHDDDDIKANTSLIFLGDTTAGKSRATRPMINNIFLSEEGKLNRRWNPDGIMVVSGAGSGEYLIEKFDERDARDDKKQHSVTGLVFFNELSMLSAKSSGASSAYKPILMGFLDGDTYVDNGTRSNGEVSAYKPFAAMLTTTQPRDLKNTLTKSDMARGLVNRFIFVCGNAQDSPPIGRSIIDWTIPRKKLEEVHDWSITKANGRETYLIDEWQPEAMDLFCEFYASHILPTKKLDSKNGGGALGRIDLHMKRLILLFAINDMSTIIRLEHVESAVGLYQYLLDCYAVVSGRVVDSKMSENMRLILEKVEQLEDKNKDEECTKRVMFDRGTLGRAMNIEEWQAAIKALTAPGGGLYRNTTSGRKDGKGGRRTETFNTYKKGGNS